MRNIDLYNGDCLQVMNNIPDKSVDMILCDLPYGTTQNKWDSVIPVETLWEHYNRVIKDDGAIVLFATPPFNARLAAYNIKNFRYSWYWEKPHTGQLNAKRMPLKNVEEIMVFYKSQPTYNPQFEYAEPYVITRTGYKGSQCYGKQKDHTTVSDGKRYPKQILKYSHDKERQHPTQKPIQLLEYLIKTYTNSGETVLDNCMGSGSTGVACVNTNRNFIGIELDENYFGIAKDRINKAVEELGK